MFWVQVPVGCSLINLWSFNNALIKIWWSRNILSRLFPWISAIIIWTHTKCPPFHEYHFGEVLECRWVSEYIVWLWHRQKGLTPQYSELFLLFFNFIFPSHGDFEFCTCGSSTDGKETCFAFGFEAKLYWNFIWVDFIYDIFERTSGSLQFPKLLQI